MALIDSAQTWQHKRGSKSAGLKPAVSFLVDEDAAGLFSGWRWRKEEREREVVGYGFEAVAKKPHLCVWSGTHTHTSVNTPPLTTPHSLNHTTHHKTHTYHRHTHATTHKTDTQQETHNQTDTHKTVGNYKLITKTIRDTKTYATLLVLISPRARNLKSRSAHHDHPGDIYCCSTSLKN